MRFDGTQLWLSPTDLGSHLECAHATTMVLAAALDGGQQGYRGGSYAEMVAAKGDEHEQAHLERLRDEARDATVQD